MNIQQCHTQTCKNMPVGKMEAPQYNVRISANFLRKSLALLGYCDVFACMATRPQPSILWLKDTIHYMCNLSFPQSLPEEMECKLDLYMGWILDMKLLFTSDSIIYRTSKEMLFLLVKTRNLEETNIFSKKVLGSLPKVALKITNIF